MLYNCVYYCFVIAAAGVVLVRFSHWLDSIKSVPCRKIGAGEEHHLYIISKKSRDLQTVYTYICFVFTPSVPFHTISDCFHFNSLLNQIVEIIAVVSPHSDRDQDADEEKNERKTNS